MAKQMRDIDKLVWLPPAWWGGACSDPAAPDRIMDELQASLEVLFPTATWPARTTHSLPIDLGPDSFSFDVVPAFRLDNGQVMIAARGPKATSPWVPSNSLDIMEAVVGRNGDTNGLFIHQVRMVKQFVACQLDGAVPGLHVESVAYQAITSPMSHDRACHTVFTAAPGILSSAYTDPAGGPLAHRLDPVVRGRAITAFSLAADVSREALDLEAGGDTAAASSNWAALFGSDFPVITSDPGKLLAAAGSATGLTLAGSPTRSTAARTPIRPTRAWRS
jgi:hypothetical protein